MQTITIDTDKVTVTTDGTEVVFTTAPVAASTDTEVDVLMSDGTTKTFVPKQ
jgi:hypothetical protein